jgi:hypothetical protein
MVFAAVTILLIIVAAVGFGLYATTSSKTTTATATTTVVSTASAAMAAVSQSGGLVNTNLTVFGYTGNYQCTPAATTLAPGAAATNATKVTACIVGAGSSSAVSGAFPVFVLVPAYAGLSIFGVQSLGASPQGYPIFNHQVVVTQCGAGGTGAACPDHPTYLYSPDFTLVEQHLGINNGVFGLPEGVLPTPAHDHVVGFTTSTSIPWYVVVVLVFDPNIMPNAVTGQCTQIVNSNLTSATGNCLNSFTALASAMSTRTTANANANSTQSDPIFDTFGGPTTQVLIPGVTTISETTPTNTNLFLLFSVASGNPYN